MPVADDFLKRIRLTEKQANPYRGMREATSWIFVSKTARGGVGNLDFENGWTDLGGSYEKVAFRLNELGMVELRGIATGGVEGTCMFTLPEDYRPAKKERWIVANGQTGSATIEVYTDGKVYLTGLVVVGNTGY